MFRAEKMTPREEHQGQLKYLKNCYVREALELWRQTLNLKAHLKEELFFFFKGRLYA